MSRFSRWLLLACALSAGFARGSAAQDSPAAIDSVLAAGTSAPTSGTLTLGRALELARIHHPALRGAAWSAKAAAERRRDAGRPSNPTLDVAAENLGGSLPPGLEELTVSAEQALGLGGKRSARAATAEALAAAANANFAAEASEALSSTVERFLDAWVLQERILRLARAEHVAEESIEAARQRFRAGAGPEVETTRAEAMHAQRQAESLRARAERSAAMRRLASQWGETRPGFDSLALDTPGRLAVPPAEDLASSLARHPERRRAAMAAALESARAREARADRVPDLALRGGVRHLSELDRTGFVAGVSMPLPVWSRNAGAVSAAEAEQQAAHERERWVALRLEQELAAARERYVAAEAAYEVLRDRVVPRSEQALRQVLAGYRSGRFGSVELLDAQRGVLDGELALIDAAADVWRARHGLERLIGGSLSASPPGEGSR